MNRSGLSQSVWLVVVIVVALAVGVALLGGAGSVIAGAENFFNQSSGDSSYTYCESQVTDYCDRHPDGNWQDRYDQCTGYDFGTDYSGGNCPE